MRDASNAPRYQVRTVRQREMLRHMRADEAVRIKYDSKYAQSANYWKNALGMNKCIDSLEIIQLKQGHEARIKHYQDSTGYLKGQLDIDKLGGLYAQLTDKRKALTYFMETFGRTNEIVTRAMRYAMGAPIYGPEDNKKKQYNQFKDNSETWDLATEKDVLAALLENYKEQVPAEYVPEFYKTIGNDYKGYVEKLYNSRLMSSEPIYFNKKKVQKEMSSDIAVQMGQDLLATMQLIRKGTEEIFQTIDDQERMLCDAKIRMEEDMPHYSDANFTLRMSYLPGGRLSAQRQEEQLLHRAFFTLQEDASR